MSPMPSAAFAAPTAECDLVMKGGVTSGLVYPFAILELARRYRFRSIGGASAGAIAAAFAAAAEYARRRDDPAGFQRLEARCRALPELLPGLFQPTAKLRPLMWLARGRGGGRLAIGLALCGGLVLLLAGLAAALAWSEVGGWPARAAASGLAVLLLALAAGAGWLTGLVRKTLPANDFGLCPGLTQPGARGPGLCDWIHQAVQEIAFGDAAATAPPLTFGVLRAVGIELRMVTTNLSMHRPHTLPELDLPFLFDREEWRRLFPAAVLDYLTHDATEPRELAAAAPPGRSLDLRRLPPADDLPVLVGVRMSLSFPLLIAAVPLWIADRWASQMAGDQAGAARPIGFTAPVEPRLRRLLFTDGGLSSNFPIHFFDSLFPTRPTFALSLDDLEPAMAADGPRVYLPRGAAGASFSPIRHIDGLADFAAGLLGAAKDWQDLLASLMPGQRERIARVFLAAGEGGLNLDMSREVCERLMAYGREAGETLAREFDFDEHRWRRGLVAYQALADLGVAAGDAWRGGYGDWLAAYARPRSYRVAMPARSRPRLHQRLGAFAELGASFTPPPSTRGFPRPNGVMRVTARF